MVVLCVLQSKFRILLVMHWRVFVVHSLGMWDHFIISTIICTWKHLQSDCMQFGASGRFIYHCYCFHSLQQKLNPIRKALRRTEPVA